MASSDRWKAATYLAVGLALNEALFLFSRHEGALATWLHPFFPGLPLIPLAWSLIGGTISAVIAAFLVLRVGRRNGSAIVSAGLGALAMITIMSQIPTSSITKAVYASTFAATAVFAIFVRQGVLECLGKAKPRTFWVLSGKVFKAGLVLGAFLGGTLAATILGTFEDPAAVDSTADSAPVSPEVADTLESRQFVRHALLIGYYAAGILFLVCRPFCGALLKAPVRSFTSNDLIAPAFQRQEQR